MAPLEKAQATAAPTTTFPSSFIELSNAHQASARFTEKRTRKQPKSSFAFCRKSLAAAVAHRCLSMPRNGGHSADRVRTGARFVKTRQTPNAKDCVRLDDWRPPHSLGRRAFGLPRASLGFAMTYGRPAVANCLNRPTALLWATAAVPGCGEAAVSTVTAGGEPAVSVLRAGSSSFTCSSAFFSVVVLTSTL
jgi:hypothetical protein